MGLDRSQSNLIASEEVCELFGISRTTLYNYVYRKNPMLPRPVVGGNRKRGEKMYWDRSEVDLYLERLRRVKASVGCHEVRGRWVPTVATQGQYWAGPSVATFEEAIEAAARQFKLIRTRKRSNE